jgi:hypothetical protein
LAIVFTPEPAASAEQIYFEYGPLLFSLSLDALETFAEKGKITREFSPYASRFDPQMLTQLRQMFQRSYTMDEVALDRMLQTPILEDFLQSLGQVINTPSGLNGFYAIRGALVSAAAEEGNWTVLDVMQRFPTDIRIDTALAMDWFNPAQASSEPQSSSAACEASTLFY